MAEEAKTTPEAEVKAPEAEKTVETTPEVTKEPVVEQTISDMIPEKEEVKPNLIPESVFLGEKKARKAAEKELAKLRAEIEGGASKEDISDSIDAIAEEHDIDKAFLKKLSSTIKAEAKAELEAELKAKSEGDNKVKQFEDSFAKGLQVALERGPEFQKLVNVDVIKQLALLPQNAKKTISQLLEDTYGNAIQGKRTIETDTTPGGGKEEAPLDFAKASKDINYFNEIMANPKHKAAYNEHMLKIGY